MRIVSALLCVGLSGTYAAASSIPEVEETIPAQAQRWVPIDQEISIRFKSPVQLKTIRSQIHLDELVRDSTRKKSSVPFKVSQPSSEKILIRPTKLTPGSLYQFRIEKKGRVYQLLQFETWYPFRLVKTPLSSCVPASFRLSFSNPVRHSDLLHHLEIRPSVESVPGPSIDEPEDGQREPTERQVWHTLRFRFAPDETYTMVVDQDLKDIFGNRLGRTQRFVLETYSDCPFVKIPTGLVHTPPDYPFHPIMTLNVESTPMKLEYLTEKEVFAVLPRVLQGRYAIELPDVARDWESKVPRNKRYQGGIDLREGSTHPESFVIVQVKDLDKNWLTAFVNVTPLQLSLIKNSSGGLEITVTDLKLNQPQANIRIELRDESTVLLWSGKTDHLGVVKVPHVPETYWVSARHPSGDAVLYSAPIQEVSAPDPKTPENGALSPQ